MSKSTFDSLGEFEKLSIAERALDTDEFKEFKEYIGTPKLNGAKKAKFRRLNIKVMRVFDGRSDSDSTDAKDEVATPKVHSEAETSKESVNGVSEVIGTASFATQYTFSNTGRTVRAEFVEIQPHDFDKVQIHRLNPRKQEGLTEASLSDILPSIKFKGISRPGYSIYVDGIDLLADSSRRFASARIAFKPLPLLRILEECSDEEIQSLIDEVDTQRQLSRYEEGLKYKEVFLGNDSSYKDTYAHFNVLPENEQTVRRSIIAACLDERLYQLFPDRYCISAEAYEKLNQQTNKASLKYADMEDPVQAWLDAADSLGEKPVYVSPYGSVDEYANTVDSDSSAVNVSKTIQRALSEHRKDVLKFLDLPFKKTEEDKKAAGTWDEKVIGDKQSKCTVVRYNKQQRELNLQMRKASVREVAALDYFLERLGDKDFLESFEQFKNN